MPADDLERFVEAQADVHDRAEREIAAGRKTGHWMWFVFPQLRGLGSSPTAWTYGLADPAEARAFLDHPKLGARLVRMVGLLLDHRGRDAVDILGPVDALKLRSCLTLFAGVARSEAERAPFAAALAAFFDGERCPTTAGALDRM
jgi:uncharacterized protein (DUF1810 family)